MINEIYTHVGTGNKYVVLHIANEKVIWKHPCMCIYKSLVDGVVYARPLIEFNEKFKASYQDVKLKYPAIFKLIRDISAICDEKYKPEYEVKLVERLVNFDDIELELINTELTNMTSKEYEDFNSYGIDTSEVLEEMSEMIWEIV